MKPFDNVVISSTEPKNNADVWIKLSKNFLNTKASYLKDTTTGITYKVNNDGSITLNGTVTKPGSYTLLEGLNLKLKGNYTFSMKIISGSFSVQGVSIAIGNAENGGAYYSGAKGILSNLIFRPNTGTDFKVTNNINDIAMYLGIYFNKNTVFDNLTFTLQLENGQEATEYEQYLEPDILVKDNGVYNSVLTKNIKTGQEIKTNNVLDGKDVYYKRVDLENLPNNTTKEVDTGLSDVNILKIDGIAKESSGTVIPLPFVFTDTTKSVAIVFNTTTNKITITTKTDRTNFSGYANLYYTKN